MQTIDQRIKSHARASSRLAIAFVVAITILSITNFHLSGEINDLEDRVTELEAFVHRPTVTDGQFDENSAPASLPVPDFYDHEDEEEAALTVDTTTFELSPELQARNQRIDQLREMPYDQCVEIDHWQFIGFPDSPRVLASGAFFDYDCQTRYWGWYFEGAPGDAWQPELIDPSLVNLPEGEYSIDLPIDLLGPPPTSRHPVYPEALTWAELTPGMTVCLRGDLNSREEVVGALVAHAYLDYNDQVVANPVYLVDGRELPSYLQENGVVPYSNGLWSTIHTTAGPC